MTFTDRLLTILLLYYICMNKENILNQDRMLVGGVIIQEDINFRYSIIEIEDTKDLTNWAFFNPSQF